MPDPLPFYSNQSMMTDPGRYWASLERLPNGIAELCGVVQGIQLHVFWADRYGVTLSADRKNEVLLRSMHAKLARLREIDARPITDPRPPENRLVGNCRDFSLILTSLLRSKGIPARLRCGFGAYFLPDHYEDHWVCEYWSADENRWILVDAQLDGFQRSALGAAFDPLDVPRDQFISGGQAWQLCRSGIADPETFGIFDMHGLWFVRGNLVRDVAALNKDELLPWDSWGIIGVQDGDLSKDDLVLLDHAAALTCADVPDIHAVWDLFRADARLTVPQEIETYMDGSATTIEWATA